MATMIATIPTARLTHVSPLGHARSKVAAVGMQVEVIATVYIAPRNEFCECCLDGNGGDGCPGALRFMATATQRAVAFIYLVARQQLRSRLQWPRRETSKPRTVHYIATFLTKSD